MAVRSGATAGGIKPMLDMNALVADIEGVERNCVQRGMLEANPRRVAELRERVSALQKRGDAIRKERNKVAKAGRGDSEEAIEARRHGAALRDEMQALEAAQVPLREALLEEALRIPNTTHAQSPIGDESAAITVGFFGELTKPTMTDASVTASESTGAEHSSIDGWTPATPPHMLDPGQTALDHSVIADNLGIVDFDAAARSTGPKFSMLTGDGAMLELGVVNHVLGRMRSRGFMPILPPDVAHQSVIAGCGFQPRGDESNIYPLEGTDLCLSATSEIALAGMLADTILPEPATSLPRLYAAFSHCFRREAGAAGRASRGLYRLHQFSKVEMMIVCENRTCDDALAEVPERLRRQGIRTLLERQLLATGAAATKEEAGAKVADRLGPRPTLISDAWLEVLVGLQAGTMSELGLRGRILNMPTMELGASAHRKFDLEAWMPGRDVGDDAPPGGWGEVTSASNCTDYQARRLGIRYRDPGTGKPVFAHTLNATAAAIPRVLVALLETYQTPTGSVRLPPNCPAFALLPEELEPAVEGQRGIHCRRRHADTLLPATDGDC